MVLTPPLIDEWRRHQSKFTREWRKSMHARRKIRTLEAQENMGLRERSLGPGIEEPLRQIRVKDLPLIEAALRADNIVASLDEEARQSFQIEELNVIIWVNPVKESRRMRLWLEQGAEPVAEWKLGRGQ
jgi:hypothetical protein